MTMDEMKIGAKAKVVELTGDGPLKRHIMELGITRGTSARVMQKAPLGDPIQISVRGYRLSLRSEDAQHIEVEIEEA